jgi:endo-1,4-beta-xylanase
LIKITLPCFISHLLSFMQNRIVFITLLLMFVFVSCKKTGDNVVTPTPPGNGSVNNSDTTLKSISPIPVGIAIDYSLYMNNSTYRNIVNREANVVVFGYQMKHGAIVKDDGSFDYSKADELFNLASSAGLQVYGHTLVWHQNQNGNYLRSLTIGTNDSNATNVLTSDFQDGTGSSGTGTSLFTGWNLLTGGAASASFAAVAGNNSSRALEVTVTTPGANAYDVQAIGPEWTAKVGNQYKVLVDIKSSVSGGKVRLVNQNTQYQQLDVTPTTTWATYTWTLTALETAPMIRLNFPSQGVYTIDNIRIIDPSTGTPLSNIEIAKAVDTAMSRFIRSTVTRYAGKIKAWDVVNEPISDGTGALRSNTGSTTGDAFYWSQYLGRNYALKAFQYAKAADPNALLFINDYNLEYDNRKLDSLIAYVNELKTKGAVIDGIGTQMHMSVNTSQASIDNMFRKLAATGLKIRVSELDIRVNPSNATGFTLTSSSLSSQAAMYKYVVDSYFSNVPAAQRYGIIVWGVGDSDSWIVTSGKTDYPLLFDGSYNKKPAYTSFLQALKSYK